MFLFKENYLIEEAIILAPFPLFVLINKTIRFSSIIDLRSLEL